MQLGSSPARAGNALRHRASHQGNPAAVSGLARLRRFIPARAGNAARARTPARGQAVHPRAAGNAASRTHRRKSRSVHPRRAGNASTTPTARAAFPVHPCARGERQIIFRRVHAHSGSSPRVRGTLPSRHQGPSRTRFIPARAGNASASRSWGSSAPVHPRACGERGRNPRQTDAEHGSSPRVRGTRQRHHRGQPFRRFTPARAGTPQEGA